MAHKVCVRVCEEGQQHVPHVQSLLRAAFEGEQEGKLVTLLRSSPQLALSLVAVVTEEHEESDVELQHDVPFAPGTVVGHVLYSRLGLRDESGAVVVPCDAASTLVALAPLAVLPQSQRMGIGSLLVRRAQRELERMGATAEFVLGHPQYYPRFGFKRGTEYSISYIQECGDSWMAREIVPGALAPYGGCTTVYDEAFNNV